MYRWFLAFLIAFAVPSFSSFLNDEDAFLLDEWDEKGFVSSPNVICYAGMQITCDAGCGDPWSDWRMEEIDRRFERCLYQTINCDEIILKGIRMVYERKEK